jgi:tetratricopeptide (TPR) repeat protein
MSHIALALHEVFLTRKTGRLIFKRGEILKYFFFKEGNLISVKTNELGEILLKLGKISENSHAKIDDYIEPGRNLGESLKDNGLISEADLKEGLLHQIRETTLNAFPYFDAEIGFQEKKDFAGSGGELQVAVPPLIEYGLRRMQFHPQIKAFLEKKVLHREGKAFLYVLTAEEKALLDKIKGETTTDALLASSNVKSDFFWMSLYLFYCLDLVAFRSKEKPGEKEHDMGGRPESLGEDLKARLSDVVELKERLPELNFYQLLNVPRDASELDIKKSYFLLARRYHPDRFDPNLPASAKDPIAEVFDAINKAYRTLSNRQERKVYDSKVTTFSREEEGDASKKAETKFRQAKTLYGMTRYEEALILLEEAVRMNRNKADYFLLLAMTETKMPSFLQKAEKDFLKAVSLDPWRAEGFVGLGLLYKSEGLLTKARRQFARALEIEPEHKIDLKELEELGGTDKKRPGLKGLLRIDLFPKKKKK